MRKSLHLYSLVVLKGLSEFFFKKKLKHWLITCCCWLLWNVVNHPLYVTMPSSHNYPFVMSCCSFELYLETKYQGPKLLVCCLFICKIKFPFTPESIFFVFP
ncbi:hypothetical protein MGC_05307 [Candida albicans P37039]|nr:hypothetical protein MGC_05307 [Candida albicans P37039]